MAIIVSCYRCKKELNAKGAIVLSPPLMAIESDGSDDVKKFHICEDCWFDLLIWMHNADSHGWLSRIRIWMENVKKKLSSFFKKKA